MSYKTYKVRFAATFETLISVPDGERIENYINNICIPESNAVQYVIDSFEVKSCNEMEVKARKYNIVSRSYAHIMTAEEWRECNTYNSSSVYNGNSYWCKDGKESDDSAFLTPQADATHVAWYNR